MKNERRIEYIVFEKSVSLPSSFPKKLLQCTDKVYLGHKKERPLLILSSEISPKNLARRKELMLAFRRGLKLVSARTAFGDASELDMESVPRRFYE